MSRVIAIMQPTYLPWVGYLAMIENADEFVFLDNVQYNHRSWQQRNRIKTPQGEDWLTISTITKGRSAQLIREVECMNLDKDINRHLAKISHNYSKSPFYKEFYPTLTQALNECLFECNNLLNLFNIELIKFLCSYVGIKKNFLRSSELQAKGQKDELLSNICISLNGTCYLSALGSKEYLDVSSRFSNANINIKYHDYIHPVYPQLYGEFIGGMSCVDMIFNTPKEMLKKTILSGCQ